jgi:hypothetical protein
MRDLLAAQRRLSLNFPACTLARGRASKESLREGVAVDSKPTLWLARTFPATGRLTIPKEGRRAAVRAGQRPCNQLASLAQAARERRRR